MARAGGAKVVSSGRISVPVRPPSCKKRVSTRKASTTSADSGYSLCSTDSEDQVLVINRGLDRCAALLHDILQSDARETTTKSPKVTFPRAPFKSSLKVKKSAVKKPTTASHVHREKVAVRKFAPSKSCNNMEVQRPPAMTSSPALPTASCDHIQTQMQLLSRAACNAAPAPAPESAVLFNCRLATSTPTLGLSSQQPANQQDAGYDVYHQSLPSGGTAHFPSPMTATSMAYSAPPASCYAQAPMQQAASAPSYHPPTHQADTPQPANSRTQVLDSDLLQYVAAHLARLHGPQAMYAPEPEKERLLTETEETSSDEEEVVTHKARDISCQTSFNNDNKKSSPKKTEQKIKTVKYLLGEIKALVGDQGDGEALRLVTELEHSVALLPAVVGSTNVHAEIALALQPLRSENTQLRRRLRILNQQLRERERNAQSDEQNYEAVTSLQSMNETLEQQLIEVQKSLESQQNRVEELLKVMESQKEENKTLSQIIQEKEEEIVQIRQQNDITLSRLKTEVEDAAGNMKSLQFKLESAEKENQILGITLRQRDAEVTRLRELTRTLQASMAKLLCDLGKDKSRGQPGAQLTRATLDSYDKQLRAEQCPANTSIISYLRRLEMDQVIPNSSDQPDPPALTSDPSDDFMISRGHINYQRAEPSVSSRSPQKMTSESCSLTGDEYKPDETTYLPLASSPHKANFVPPARLMCTPPKVCEAERDAEALEKNRTIPRSLFNAPEALEKPTKMQEAAPKPKGQPSILNHHLRNLRIADSRLNDQSAFDVLSATSDWSIASFSTFTSHDEADFRNGLAALDANIAKLQRTLQSDARKEL